MFVAFGGYVLFCFSYFFFYLFLQTQTLNSWKTTKKRKEIKKKHKSPLNKSISTYCKHHIEEDKEAFEASVNFPHLQFFKALRDEAEHECACNTVCAEINCLASECSHRTTSHRADLQPNQLKSSPDPRKTFRNKSQLEVTRR